MQPVRKKFYLPAADSASDGCSPGSCLPLAIAFNDATHYREVMERKSFAAMGCSVAQCLDVVGDSWTMLIVRDAFFGITRFDEFQDRLGIPRNTLRDRLQKLVDAGVLVTVPYSEHPPRSDYRLTDAGRDLWPVLTAMRQWGDRHGSPAGPARLVHTACGTPAEATVVCPACDQVLGPDDTGMVLIADRAAGAAEVHVPV
jgi:DNA-binding HxlR family transcriptional regulator